jgi:hypothetical protein
MASPFELAYIDAGAGCLGHVDSNKKKAALKIRAAFVI